MSKKRMETELIIYNLLVNISFIQMDKTKHLPFFQWISNQGDFDIDLSGGIHSETDLKHNEDF